MPRKVNKADRSLTSDFGGLVLVCARDMRVRGPGGADTLTKCNSFYSTRVGEKIGLYNKTTYGPITPIHYVVLFVFVVVITPTRKTVERNPYARARSI